MNQTSDFRSQDATLTLDVRDLRCPMPLLKVKQRLRGMAAGQSLRVLASDPGARRDIPAWLRQTSHSLVHIEEHDGVIEFLIVTARDD